MKTPWESLDDPRALGAALDGISTLSELLERERAAVSALDAAGLAALAEQKQLLIDELRQLAAPQAPALVATKPLQAQQRALRVDVRDAAVRLLAQAEANTVLLNDAIHALQAALGIEQELGTYDAHARLRRRVRAFAGGRL